MSGTSRHIPLGALLVSLLALAGFWLVVYDAGPVTTAAMLLEALAIIALAFLVASRSSR